MAVQEKELVDSLQDIDKVPVFNGIPNFPNGFKFANKFQVEERIGWDDNIGATYFVVPLESDRPFELVLRLDNVHVHVPSILQMEVTILKMVEEKNKHLLFAQLHSHGLTGEYGWYCTFFRGGPSLSQIVDFMQLSRQTTRFTPSTVGRFAENLYQILEFLHSNGFLLSALSHEMFHFDAASRNLFLSDLSSIRKYVHDQPVKIRWTGCCQYRPLLWTDGDEDISENLKKNCELEAIFYLVLEFALGSLPWSLVSFDECHEMKNIFAKQQVPEEMINLPEEYRTLWTIIKDIVLSDSPYQSLDIILAQCKEIYQKAGSCLDLDEDFDFERQPTEDELPRFVMEKVPKEGVNDLADDPENKPTDNSEDKPTSEPAE